MKTYPIAEIRNRFSSLINEVREGADIGISYGRKKEPIAVIVPLAEYNKMKKRQLGTLETNEKPKFSNDWSLSDEELLKS
ncbi:MAG: type II toxin-antitoxin system Phd/YefM family antitoxin [Candidatus Marinimicrobia bacterium]|nr:type II toxin-antitoxin system Phd/YefM family antitoxin [Candidatus Neomarinimicrobiota bacterium]